MPTPSAILFDAERLKYPHTGLYHFCYQLGKHLIHSEDPLHSDVGFFLPKKAMGIYGEAIELFQQQEWHKLWLPLSKSTKVWHATHQSSRYFPSRSAAAIVLTIHDLNFLYTDKSEGEKKSLLRQLQRQIDRAQVVTFISQFTQQDCQQHLNLQNKPQQVIYNGCNIEPLEHLAEPTNAPKQPFLFSIGTIMAKKNFHVLPGLLVGNDRQLVISGIVQQESYRQQILEEAKRWNVADRVHFTGPISENDKQWYLRNCEAFLFPSLMEGFGLPVVEAMRFGKPVFLSTATSLPEIGGNAAFYFPNFDQQKMQTILEKGLSTYRANHMENEIRNRALAFSWTSAATDYLEIYRRLM